MKITSFRDFSVLLDALIQPVFVHDTDFRIIYANQAYIKLAKKPLKQILRQLYWTIFPKLKSPTPARLKALKQGEATQEELKIAPNIIYLSRAISIHVEKKYQYSIHILEDISQHKNALRKLQAEKEELNIIIEGFVDPFFIHDQQGRFIAVNDAACEMTGYSRKKLLTLSVMDVEKGLPRRVLNQSWRSAIQGNVVTLAGKHQRQDGSEYPAEIHIGALTLKEKPLLLAIVRNMTAHYQLQENLKRRIAFEKLVQEITTQLNDIQHLEKELKNIIQSLGEFSNVSRSYLFRYNPENDTITNTHEWCAPKIKSYIKELQKLPFSKGFPWLAQQLKALQVIQINKLSDLPRDSARFKKELQRQSITSILLSPIFYGHHLLGFIGLDQVGSPIKWNEGDIELLTTVSYLIGQAYLQQENLYKDKTYKQNLKSMLYKMVETLANTLEQRDPYTCGHQQRVAALAIAIARKMKLSEDEINGIYLGALIHDLGKIHIPIEILTSPLPLTSIEYKLIQEHPQVGYEIIKDVPFVWPIKDILLQHHERLNGSGYPKGLKGDDISLAARIVAVADVYEAMTAHRPYRPKHTKQATLLELKKNSGKLYDPEVVKQCVDLIEHERFQFPKLKKRMKLFISK